MRLLRYWVPFGTVLLLFLSYFSSSLFLFFLSFYFPFFYFLTLHVFSVFGRETLGGQDCLQQPGQLHLQLRTSFGHKIVVGVVSKTIGLLKDRLSAMAGMSTRKDLGSLPDFFCVVLCLA